jgi:hypothetical protein
MDWDRHAYQTDVLDYCAMLRNFLIENLWEEEIMIGTYPVSHVQESLRGTPT